jgi:hypothetical protein
MLNPLYLGVLLVNLLPNYSLVMTEVFYELRGITSILNLLDFVYTFVRFFFLTPILTLNFSKRAKILTCSVKVPCSNLIDGVPVPVTVTFR